jgi:hypothetical protein
VLIYDNHKAGRMGRRLPVTEATATLITGQERKLQAWPDIAKAIGLAGLEVMSATVDVWGWRARFRLARGQTIKDVVTKIPAIESGLGTFRGAVRVYPTPDDLANRCEIRVLNMDPHAGSIPWPGPSVTSIIQPVDLGPFEDASPCLVLFARLHGIFGGTTGSGKSAGLNVPQTPCADLLSKSSSTVCTGIFSERTALEAAWPQEPELC